MVGALCSNPKASTSATRARAVLVVVRSSHRSSDSSKYVPVKTQSLSRVTNAGRVMD